MSANEYQDDKRPSTAVAGRRPLLQRLRTEQVQRRAVHDALYADSFSEVGTAPPVGQSSSETSGSPGPEFETQADALKGGGQPLTEPQRQFYEARLRQDLGAVRIHTDNPADRLARQVQARAFTLGRDIVFGRGQFQPRSQEGRRLLAHELVHVGQQGKTAGKTSTLQRTPVAPSWGGQTGVFDRSKVAIDEIPTLLAATSAGVVTLSPPLVSVKVAINEPGVNHMSWYLYDPSDNLVNGYSTLKTHPQATSDPFELDGSDFNGAVTQGRYLLRCIGRTDGKPMVYADRTFFVWTSAPLSMQEQPALTGITSAPATHSLSEVGAAYARSMMLQHRAAIAAGGTGKYMGTQAAGATPAGVARQDCTTYVLEVLKHAFNAKGEGATWTTVYNEAQTQSAGSFKGTELIRALVAKAGWKAVFWAPDPRNPSDALSEHPVAYKGVRETGKYYKIPVDNTKSVVEYRPTSATKQENMTRLDQLRKVPLAVVAAKGGMHMTLLLNGDVYEVHWTKAATDPDVITAEPLEKWVWQSGVVVMPSASFTAAMTP